MEEEIIQFAKIRSCHCQQCGHDWEARDNYKIKADSTEAVRDSGVPVKCERCYSRSWLTPPLDDTKLLTVIERLTDSVERLNDDIRALRLRIWMLQKSGKKIMIEPTISEERDDTHVLGS